MKWKNANFESKDIADMCVWELRIAGIKTGSVFQADIGIHNHTVYFVPYMPIGKDQEETAMEIISAHLW